jgi:hypothetical protein
MNKMKHREAAIAAYQEALIGAEKRINAEYLGRESKCRALLLLDLAELHILANQAGKAESELKEALTLLLNYDNTDIRTIVEYEVYILQTLSGIHACMGLAKEARTEMYDAQKLEEKLFALKRLDGILSPNTQL